MLGRDSTGLRVDTQCALRILTGLTSQENREEEGVSDRSELTGKSRKKKIGIRVHVYM